MLFHVSIIFIGAAFYVYPEGSAIVFFLVWILFFVLQNWRGTTHEAII